MTDEGMAEEYENAQDYCGLLDVLFEEQYNQDYGGLRYYISPYIEQAFLAGLKAGRPKWHKVADGDLPKENKLYLVAIKDNGLAIAYFNGRYWEMKYNLGDFGYCVETVIAWCEIPEVPNNLKESK